MFSAIYDAMEAEHQPKFYVKNGKASRGLEQPARAAILLNAFRSAGWPIQNPDAFGLDPILKIHTERYLSFLQRANAYLGSSAEGDAELVATITRDSSGNYPLSLLGQVEWHMFDVFSPIGSNTYAAALGSASVALTGARLLRDGARSAYALCRPPGHHAHADYGGGYCYFNNAAIAAEELSSGGNRVAILDVDADHGNGTQDIFYERDDVLHVSLHADPSVSYPYYSGYEDESGKGAGIGANINIPLALGTDDKAYLNALSRGLDIIAKFNPRYCVVALGVDGHVDEPNQVFKLTTDCYYKLGEALFELGLPTLFTQEGGYNLTTLARNVLAVATPFARGADGAIFPPEANRVLPGLAWATRCGRMVKLIPPPPASPEKHDDNECRTGEATSRSRGQRSFVFFSDVCCAC
ncbi:histone deacetylase family protein [Allomesorhizobium camelthorni]|uniref:Histone deacetylase family protein n=1 Tax=Allomesorhizobium camelthorni TaxID=475069 RepID=A0A6G4WGF3_9HYPH|nr:histone deacetylase family protein [Mesorhizobium camelthorni]NGO53872.1 histone deacetylase family protein [Mesorhizobium camelthorni]